MKLPFAAIVLATACLSGGAVAQSSSAQKSATSTVQQRRPVDCHRDVREHRVNGVRIRHRHVGEYCEIRVVKQVN